MKKFFVLLLMTFSLISSAQSTLPELQSRNYREYRQSYRQPFNLYELLDMIIRTAADSNYTNASGGGSGEPADSSWVSVSIGGNPVSSDAGLLNIPGGIRIPANEAVIQTGENTTHDILIQTYTGSTYRTLAAFYGGASPVWYGTGLRIQPGAWAGNFSYLDFNVDGTSSGADATFLFTQTTDREFTFPNKSGTVAMLSDITGGGASFYTDLNLSPFDSTASSTWSSSDNFNLSGNWGFAGNVTLEGGGQTTIGGDNVASEVYADSVAITADVRTVASSRNVQLEDVGAILKCTASVTITLTEGFTQMDVGQSFVVMNYSTSPLTCAVDAENANVTINLVAGGSADNITAGSGDNVSTMVVTKIADDEYSVSGGS
jgi:hypothetical protein